MGIISFIELAQIRLIVLPLSEFPPREFENYVKILREKCQVIDLSKLPASSESDIISKKMGSSLGGSMCMNFMTSIDPVSNDFIDFQLHHRIFGILGLVHLPSISHHLEISNLFDEFKSQLDSFKKQFSYRIPTEIFALKPQVDFQIPEGLITIKEHLLEHSLLDHIKTFSISIIKVISELYTDFSQRLSLPSPCGIETYSGTASRQSTKDKMRLSGRLQKLEADLHLLTGSYSEAVACYVAASEDAKTGNDLIWGAAAQEGFFTALCLQNEQLTNSSDKTEIYKSLYEKLVPLTTSYERSGTPILSIDLQITCSRINNFIEQRHQAISILSAAWKSCNLLGFDERIIGNNRILKEFFVMRFKRKWAFYMNQMAQSFKLAQQPEMALLTLAKTLPIYNISQKENISTSHGWPMIQSSILKEMVKLSENHSNRLLLFVYSWMYLSYSNYWQDSEDQVRIIETLKKRSIQDIFAMNSLSSDGSLFCGLPIFLGISLEKGIDNLFTVEDIDSSDRRSNPFIYAPDRNSNIGTSNNSLSNPSAVNMNSTTSKSNILFQYTTLKADLTSLIAEEWITFSIALSNPFVFPISLKNIYLITDESESDGKTSVSEQISVILAPMTKSRQVFLNFLPKNSGQLKVLGCRMTFLNVEIEFPVKERIFEVIEEQPFLKEQHNDIDDLLENTFLHFQIFEGEIVEKKLKFYNSGPVEINEMNVNIVESNEDKTKILTVNPEFEINEILFGIDQESCIQIVSLQCEDPSITDESLQILPKTATELNLKIYGKSILKNYRLEIFYTKTRKHWRKLVLPLKISIISVLKISDFQFFPNPEAIDCDCNRGCDRDCDDCIGTFMLENLENYPIDLDVQVQGDKNCNGESKIGNGNIVIPPHSFRRILFSLPKLDKSNLNLLENKLTSIGEKKMAAVRKVRRRAEVKFNQNQKDETEIDDFIFDQNQFCLKRHLIDSLKIRWNMFEDSSRSGEVVLTQAEIREKYYNVIWDHKAAVFVQDGVDEFFNVTIGDEIKVNFVSKPDHDEPLDYYLKIFPTVELDDNKLGLEYDSILKYSGFLESILRNVSKSTPEMRTLSFYPFSTASFKIFYQIVEMKSGKVSWCKKPIRIVANKLL